MLTLLKFACNEALSFRNTTFESANFSPPTNVQSSPEDVFWMFRFSFMYYSSIGCLITALVAYPISLLTGGMPNLDEVYLAPLRRSKQYREASKKLQDTEEMLVKETKINERNLVP